MREQNHKRENNENAQWERLIRDSDEMIARNAAAATLVGELTTELYGTTICQADCAKLGLFKNAVISGDFELFRTESFMAELESHPVIAAAISARETRDRIEAGTADEELEAIGKLPRAARISEARRLGLGTGTRSESTEEVSERTHLRRIASLSPQQRINYTRKHNLAGPRKL